MNKSALSNRTNFSRAYISMVFSRKRIPNEETAKKLEQAVCGKITADQWRTLSKFQLNKQFKDKC